MVLLDIKFDNKEHLFCYDEILLALAKWKNIDCNHIYIYRWGFDFNVEKADESGRIGSAINILEHKLDKPFYDQLGIKAIHNKITKINQDILNIIISTIKYNKVPVAILFDSYYNPMHKNYKKMHVYYYILLIGVSANESFYFLDNQHKEKLEEIKYIDIMENTIEFCIFEFYKPHLSNISLYEETKKIVSESLKNNYLYNVLNDFIKYISILSVKKETEYSSDNIFFCELYHKLFIIENFKKTFINSFIYINEFEHKNCIEITNEILKKDVNYWWTIRMLIGKECMSGKCREHVIIPKIKLLFEKIRNIEMEFALCF